ncbi:Spy/CpxP family protein refolding chaperone [uncultured Desulfuromusa sp.]|uniref:Spy/CpxP family protein refolding chaperone n=1 Tax=uncultured Desulfuromusa sp. TaxID=219183 RepID=UPI002AA5FEBC|nr:Spy/CpxP family protein refolding chaperone [uncultured Desulfuromusa sp.]
MKKTTIIPVLLVTLLLSAGTSFAWPGGQGKRACDNSYHRQGQRMNYEQHQVRMENRLEKMAVILDLTEEQQTQIEALIEKQWQDRQSMRAQMQTSRNDLRAYKQGNEFNESEFRAKAQKHADLKTEMMVQHAKTRQQLFAVLTPEQQQKAEKLRALHGEGFFGPQHGNRDGYGQGMRSGKGCGQRWN